MNALEAVSESLGVLDQIPIGIFTINQRFIVTYWNACMEEWTGIPRGKIKGTDLSSHFPHFREPHNVERIALVLDGTAPAIFSSQLHRNIFKSFLPNGNPRIQHTTAIPLPSFAGDERYALFTVEDVSEVSSRISELNGIQRLLQDANDKMWMRIEERTADLAAANRRLELEILERQQTEKALEQERDRARKYLDVAGVMLIVVDRNGKLRLINRKGCEVLECSEQEVVGKDWCESFVPANLRERVRTLMSGLLSGDTKQFEYFENPVLSKSAAERLIAWHNTTLYDQNGEIEAILSSGEDITERRQAEESVTLALAELEAANCELKQMQSQLVQSEKLAAIGQLAAGVAHEMNTPVGFVASNFQTLENYIDKFRKLLETHGRIAAQIGSMPDKELLGELARAKELRDDLNIDFILEDIEGLFADSREGLERVTDIISNLKDFSRIGNPGTREEYCLNDGITATLTVARNEIKYDAEVKTEFSELPSVLCNSGQINQVFLNILLNAVQAIKSQERHNIGNITIRTYATETNVVCEISDDGPGVPDNVMPKLFDPFFTTKPVGKGTGLGLSVSYDIIVNKHRGELLVDSTVGKGTMFTIKLPIRKEGGDNPQQENAGC